MSKKFNERKINKQSKARLDPQNVNGGTKRSPFSRFIPKPLFTPETNQQVMSYFFKDYDGEGVFRIDDTHYSITFEYTDISFAKTDQNVALNVFLSWVDYLNSFSESTHVQILSAGIPTDTETFKQQFLFDNPEEGKENPNKQIEKITGEFNTLVSQTIGYKKNTLITKRYITLTTEAKDMGDAYDKLMALVRKSEGKFKEIGSKITVLDSHKRMEIIHDFWNIDTMYDKEIKDAVNYANENNLTIYDVLAPQHEAINMKDDDCIVIEQLDKTEIEEIQEINTKKKYIRALYLGQKLPQTISPRVYNAITTIPEIHMFSTVNIQPIQTAKAVKAINKKRTGLETERYDKIKKLAKEGVDYSFLPDKRVEDGIENYNELLYDIQKNDQKIFESNMIVCILATSKEQLDTDTEKVMEKAAEMMVEFHILKWQQLEGVMNCLPLGHNTIQFQRTDTSEMTACFTPFNSKDFMHPKSIFYGQNQISGNGIFLDRKDLMNGNGCVLATSGSGKSFAVKMLIEQVLVRYPQDEVIIIDFQKEYQKLIEAFGGQTVEISANANTFINPLDLDENYDLSDSGRGAPIKSKIEYMQSFIEAILNRTSESNDLSSSIEQSVVDRCCNIVYREYIESGYKDKSKLPLLKNFHMALTQQPEPEARQLAKALERYVTGSLNIFSHETNVDIHNRLICFDIMDLPDSIQSVGYLVLLDYIMNRLVANQKLGRSTWIFIDEFHILLNNKGGADYVAKIYKIARKFKGMPTVITQNIADVLKTEQGRKILGNSDFAMLMRQMPVDIPEIQRIFGISDEEISYITGKGAGRGIIVFAQEKIPFVNRVKDDFLIYELNNTSNMMISRV